jgi:hypothetical protein
MIDQSSQLNLHIHNTLPTLLEVKTLTITQNNKDLLKQFDISFLNNHTEDFVISLADFVQVLKFSLKVVKPYISHVSEEYEHNFEYGNKLNLEFKEMNGKLSLMKKDKLHEENLSDYYIPDKKDSSKIDEPETDIPLNLHSNETEARGKSEETYSVKNDEEP